VWLGSRKFDPMVHVKGGRREDWEMGGEVTDRACHHA